MPAEGVPAPLLTGPWQLAQVSGRLACDPEPGVPWQVLQEATAVASVQGVVEVQAWLSTGAPPVQPAGDEVSTVRVWVLFDWQTP
jgi:hypothetical protein